MIEVRPTMMDRMVAAFSPERGMRRLAARASYTAIAAATSPVEPGGRITGRGGYKGGQSDRRQTRGWFARAQSANGDGLPQQKTLIARSRDATMSMPIATAAVERRIAFTVGSGLMAIPDLDAKALGITEDAAGALTAQIAGDYDRYMASTDPDAERGASGYGLQEITLRGVLEGGDMLGLRVMPEGQRGRRSLTAWKLVEADRIVSPLGHQEGERLGGTGPVVVGGVEVDGYGAPVAFHVLKKAPPTYGAGAASGRFAGDTVRIEAWGEKSELPSAVHVMAKRRADQARGVPMLAPVLETLRQVSDLTEAELFAAVLQGMLAVIYKSTGATPMPEPDYGPEGSVESQRGLDDPSRPMANYRLEAGSVMEIENDADVDLKSPGRPNPAFDPFFQAIVRQIAAGVEVPFEVLMMHFTASYSASRGALELFYISVKRWREWLASHWCAPSYECWLYEQVARGRYRMPGFFTNPVLRELWSNVRFRGDGKISIDPAKEAKALEIHEAHAWSTGAEITAALNGGDYDVNVRRRIGEHKRFVEGGLPIPNQMGGGAAPADGAGDGSGDRQQQDPGEQE